VLGMAKKDPALSVPVKADTPPARLVTTKEDQVDGRIGPRRRELRAAQRMAISAQAQTSERGPALFTPVKVG
jgi:hypothetical protein